jgi:hypothetical protein
MQVTLLPAFLVLFDWLIYIFVYQYGGIYKRKKKRKKIKDTVDLGS